MKHRLLAALAAAVLIVSLLWLTSEKETNDMSILGGASKAGGAIGGGSGFAGSRSGDLSGRSGGNNFNRRLVPGRDVRPDPLDPGLAGRVAAQVPFDAAKVFHTMDAADALAFALQTNLGPLGLIGGFAYAALDYFNRGGRADWTEQGTAAYGDVTGQTGGATVGKPTEKTVAPAEGSLLAAKPGEPAPQTQEVAPAEPQTTQAIKGSLGGRDAAIRAQAARSGGPRTAGSPLGLDTVAPTKRKRLLGN